VYVLAVGMVTGIVSNRWFERKVPADAWNVLALVGPAVLFGLLLATYAVPWPEGCRVSGRAGAGGVLSFLAAGCPLCNKLVVLALGASGALEVFRPLQPLLGLLSLILLGVALSARLRIRARSSRLVMTVEN